MTAITVVPDIEGALRDWLRTVTSITTLVANRVFMGYPRGEPELPLIALKQVGGAMDAGEAPTVVAVIQFDCWGAGQNKSQANDVKLALIGALFDLRGGTPLTAAVRALGATVLNAFWSPDPLSNQARYVVDAQVQAIAIAHSA